MGELISLIIIFVSLFSAEGALKSCFEFGEYCVDIRSCYKNDPKVQNYQWLRQNRKHLKFCGKVDDNWAPKVCCKTKLNAENCGVNGAGNRMVNGNDAKPFDYPWMALLQDKKGAFVCSGTLITPRFVLSAAHCVYYNTIVSVRVGENDISKLEDCNVLDQRDDQKECAPVPQDITVDRIKRHEKHSERDKRDDITVLRLTKPAVMGKSVRTICLPTKAPDQYELSKLTVAGWGLNELNKPSVVLQYGTVEHLPFDNCTKTVRESLNMQSFSSVGHICTHSDKNKTNTCSGDSGGPLMSVGLEIERFVQYGVVSFGSKLCGIKNEPTVFTSVVPHMDWIFEIVEGN